MRALCALVSATALLGCAAETAPPAPPQTPDPAMARAAQACGAPGGELRTATQAYYGCIGGEALRLSRSGGAAAEIATAAPLGCASQRSAAERLASACRSVYSRTGLPLFDDWMASVDQNAAAVATRAVLEVRTPPPH